MKHLFLTLLFIASFISTIHAEHESYVKIGNVRLWCETFGKKNDPALLLIMGSGGQGIMWPDEFCNALKESGYFVIRYDHRDTGLSSSTDYAQSPYSLLDLGKDAIGILDAFGIEKAHVVGASMGGSIAILLGAYYPERLHTMTLMVATSDLSTIIDPSGNNKCTLPGPKKEYLAWINQNMMKLNESSSREDKLNLFVEVGRQANGTKVPYDEEFHRKLMSKVLDRTQNFQGHTNHLLACKASLELLPKAIVLVKAPTLIINGTEDPIFPPEHGYALKNSIAGSKLILIDGLGHCCNPMFFEDITKAIALHAV